MSYVYSETILGKRKKGLFVERYPQFMSWLDGQTWALEIETEIHESLPAFRANLYYQARELGSRLATKQVTTPEGVKVLLVRAYED